MKHDVRIKFFSHEATEITSADKVELVAPLQARAHLLEEMADVYVPALALNPDRMTIEAIARQKSRRWEERLNGKT